ncbi:MAG: ATPase [Vulcanisaeta sp.]|nr:ATPase [Vulcanisaeta sp.]MCG2886435.1 ATPase [Vulcanisaeta sp.]
MVKGGKRRIVIEVDEQQYEALKRLKSMYHSRSWADLLLKRLDNALLISMVMEIHDEVKDLSRAMEEALKLIREGGR